MTKKSDDHKLKYKTINKFINMYTNTQVKKKSGKYQSANKIF